MFLLLQAAVIQAFLGQEAQEASEAQGLTAPKEEPRTVRDLTAEARPKHH